MTIFRIQVWPTDDIGGEPAYIVGSYSTYAEAEQAARRYCSGLPYRFEIEEEAVVDYLTLVA
jgi:hypothetical protein